MNIDIICPLYNCENIINNLNNSIIKQSIDASVSIKYILTKSTDDSKETLKKNNIDFVEIEKEDFSHSLTREKAARESKADIICFISQDIEIANTDWLSELVKPLICGDAEASFSRQISKYKNIEKYTREYNYPHESYIRSKKDISKYGLKTFFFSDVSSAIKKDVFEELNYYDNKNLITNEDMYLAYKIITSGYRIKYCSKSIVYHSHDYNLKNLYLRYKNTGIFFRDNKYLKKYEVDKTGFNMAKYIFLSIIKNKDIKSLFMFPFDMVVRYIGMKIGENV